MAGMTDPDRIWTEAAGRLRNEIGEYNCFLNVIIQCLWRCAEFRQQVGKTWWAKCLYRH